MFLFNTIWQKCYIATYKYRFYIAPKEVSLWLHAQEPLLVLFCTIFFSLKGETMAAETFKSNFKARICARIERDIWNPWSRMLMRFKSTSSQSMAWITRSTKGCNDPVHYVWTMSQFSIVKDVSMTTFFFLSLEQLKHHCSPQSPHVKFHLYYIWLLLLYFIRIIYYL